MEAVEFFCGRRKEGENMNKDAEARAFGSGKMRNGWSSCLIASMFSKGMNQGQQLNGTGRNGEGCDSGVGRGGPHCCLYWKC